VTQTLSKLGLNPDNMLVIMHQGLGDAFSVVTPQEKLSMVEDAVGLSAYRKSLLEAKERLEKIKSEREEKEKELQSVTVALERWKEQYEKFVKLQELKRKIASLKVEEVWAKVTKAESSLHAIQERLERLHNELEQMQSRIKEQNGRLSDARIKYEKALVDYTSSERMRQKSAVENDIIKVARQKGIEEVIRSLFEDELLNEEYLNRADIDVANTLNFLNNAVEEIASNRERLAVLNFRLNELQKEEKQLMKQREETKSEIEILTKEADSLGRRPESIRSINDIQAEIKVAEIQIKEFGDVAADAEQMYNEFKSKITQLSERIGELDRNKHETLKEVQDRFSVWKREIQGLIAELSKKYGEVLSTIGANGRVAIINVEEPVNAGLVLLVSFRGDQLVPLDEFTQSGGERSTAVAAFLLALQGKVVSPFRAVDEFDVHMDRINRQLFMKTIYEMFRKDASTQYLVITPIEPDVYDPNANYIMVHKVASSSRARQVEKVAAK